MKVGARDTSLPSGLWLHGPKTLGALDASWTWFMTAEDTLEIAEDGFLFYYFSHELPNLIEATGKAAELIKPLKTHRNEFSAEEGSATVRGIKSDAIHHAYVAQRLSPQYWKGGVTFNPAENAKSKYSFNAALVREVVQKDRSDKAAERAKPKTNSKELIKSTQETNDDHGYLEVEGGDVENFGGGDKEFEPQGLPVWHCLTNTKEQALAKIKGKPPGAFVIRPSDKAYAAISMVKPDGTSIFQQHIEESPQGLCLKASCINTADLNAFVAHYCSGAQTDLPCPLIDNY